MVDPQISQEPEDRASQDAMLEQHGIFNELDDLSVEMPEETPEPSDGTVNAAEAGPPGEPDEPEDRASQDAKPEQHGLFAELDALPVEMQEEAPEPSDGTVNAAEAGPPEEPDEPEETANEYIARVWDEEIATIEEPPTDEHMKNGRPMIDLPESDNDLRKEAVRQGYQEEHRRGVIPDLHEYHVSRYFERVNKQALEDQAAAKEAEKAARTAADENSKDMAEGDDTGQGTRKLGYGYGDPAEIPPENTGKKNEKGNKPNEAQKQTQNQNRSAPGNGTAGPGSLLIDRATRGIGLIGATAGGLALSGAKWGWESNRQRREAGRQERAARTAARIAGINERVSQSLANLGATEYGELARTRADIEAKTHPTKEHLAARAAAGRKAQKIANEVPYVKENLASINDAMREMRRALRDAPGYLRRGAMNEGEFNESIRKPLEDAMANITNNGKGMLDDKGEDLAERSKQMMKKLQELLAIIGQLFGAGKKKSQSMGCG